MCMCMCIYIYTYVNAYVYVYMYMRRGFCFWAGVSTLDFDEWGNYRFPRFGFVLSLEYRSTERKSISDCQLEFHSLLMQL